MMWELSQKEWETVLLNSGLDTTFLGMHVIARDDGLEDSMSVDWCQRRDSSPHVGRWNFFNVLHDKMMHYAINIITIYIYIYTHVYL